MWKATQVDRRLAAPRLRSPRVDAGHQIEVERLSERWKWPTLTHSVRPRRVRWPPAAGGRARRLPAPGGVVDGLQQARPVHLQPARDDVVAQQRRVRAGRVSTARRPARAPATSRPNSSADRTSGRQTWSRRPPGTPGLDAPPATNPSRRPANSSRLPVQVGQLGAGDVVPDGSDVDVAQGQQRVGADGVDHLPVARLDHLGEHADRVGQVLSQRRRLYWCRPAKSPANRSSVKWPHPFLHRKRGRGCRRRGRGSRRSRAGPRAPPVARPEPAPSARAGMLPWTSDTNEILTGPRYPPCSGRSAH